MLVFMDETIFFLSILLLTIVIFYSILLWTMTIWGTSKYSFIYLFR